MSENVSIREIAWRQYNVGRPASFFIRIVGQGFQSGPDQLGRDAVVRFECENSAIDVIINFL
jgi:hypothetical protein